MQLPLELEEPFIYFTFSKCDTATRIFLFPFFVSKNNISACLYFPPVDQKGNTGADRLIGRFSGSDDR